MSLRGRVAPEAISSCADSSRFRDVFYRRGRSGSMDDTKPFALFVSFAPLRYESLRLCALGGLCD